MCETHLGKHLVTLKNHKYEDLDIEIEQSRFLRLKSEISIRIQKIDEAENMIAYTTKSLIKNIEKEHKEAIKRLDSLRTNYFEFLEHKKFCTSEIQIIEKIETMVSQVKTLKIDKIMNHIEKVYGGELVNYFDKRGNSYIEMSLKEKIDYYFGLIFQKDEDYLNYCHSFGRELLVSNDGKYLFFCKLHLGI